MRILQKNRTNRRDTDTGAGAGTGMGIDTDSGAGTGRFIQGISSHDYRG